MGTEDFKGEVQKGSEWPCLTLERFRSKSYSSVPTGSVVGFLCKIKVDGLFLRG